MTQKSTRFILILALLILVGGGWYAHHYLKKPEPLYIGLAASVQQLSSKKIEQAATLYLEQLNGQGGIDGREVKLIVQDDSEDVERAAKRLIDSQALVVIGHESSDASITAGKHYQQAHLPAISPISTNVNVTRGNDWYFRTIFNDELQGQFLAYYVSQVLDNKAIAVIHDTGAYGHYLAGVFIDGLRKQEATLTQHWQVDAKDPELNTKLQQIAATLAEDQETQAIFLSTGTELGVKLVKALQDAKAPQQMLAPDSYAGKDFVDSFQEFAQTRDESELNETMSHYTNGIYVSSPLVFASADQNVQRFREQYYQRFAQVADWETAFTYDAVHVAVEAIKAAKITQQADQNLAQQREQVRQSLANINSKTKAVEGITGLNYFDEYGDMNKTVKISVYRQRQLVPALSQLKSIRNSQEIADIGYFEQKKRISKFNDQYFYNTNVVYTGIDLQSITQVNFDDSTCELGFKIWFRYHGSIKPENIVFKNAVTPITLEEPIESIDYKQSHYRLYEVKGNFKLDFLATDPEFNHHFLGLSFIHKNIDQNNMIYVIDNIGMGLENGNTQKLTQQYNENHVLSVSLPWDIVNVRLFQDLFTRSILGHPNYLNSSNGELAFSRFNIILDLQRQDFLLANYFNMLTIVPILLILISGLFILLLIEKHPEILPYRKPVLVSELILSAFLLIAVEIVLTKQAHHLNDLYEPAMTLVNILWWLIPAVFLNIFIEHFIWQSLEKRANRSIPRVLKGMISALVYLFAFFAVISFVFGMQITGLLATSGVIAMIIGLAIQLNISNIFSGIALNLESPFHIGDWIRVKDYPEGQFLDMTWRSTRIKTRDNALLCIPNSLAAEAILVNFSTHTSYRLNLYLHIDVEHHPDRVRKVLLDSCYATDAVLSDPAPAVLFPEIKEGIAVYLVACSIADYGQRPSINHQLWLKLWTHLNQAHIYPAVRTQQIQYQRAKALSTNADAVNQPLQLIDIIDIFANFPTNLKQALAQKLHLHNVAANTQIVQQGDEGDSLFIIAEGVVSVSVLNKQQQSIEVARLGTGAFFGEMGLLTGEERTATVTALTRTLLFELSKADLAPFIASNPELSSCISETLMQRQQATESQLDRPLAEHESELDDGFADRMRQKILNFFGVK